MYFILKSNFILSKIRNQLPAQYELDLKLGMIKAFNGACFQLTNDEVVEITFWHKEDFVDHDDFEQYSFEFSDMIVSIYPKPNNTKKLNQVLDVLDEQFLEIDPFKEDELVRYLHFSFIISSPEGKDQIIQKLGTLLPSINTKSSYLKDSFAGEDLHEFELDITLSPTSILQLSSKLHFLPQGPEGFSDVFQFLVSSKLHPSINWAKLTLRHF